MAGLRIRLFGKLRVQRGERPVEGLAARKVQELLAYLLLHRRPQTRETLATLLWGEHPTAQSRSYLRKTLWLLQSVFGPEENLLLVDQEWVQINPSVAVWLDVGRFEQVYELASGLSGEQLDEPQLQAMEEAVALYEGDLLEGVYEEWCLYERERLQMAFLAMLDKLMAACEIRAKYDQGIDHGTAILRHDSAREQTHRRLMRLHYLAGDRSSALRQHERCVAALQRELGVQPTEATSALYRRIRDDLPLEPAPTQTSLHAPEVLARLVQIQSALDELHQQLHDELATAIAALSASVR
jgi:DNA-binding SARP family transcriptional activator